MPSATASWRLNLLRSGGLPDAQLAGIRCGSYRTPFWVCGANWRLNLLRSGDLPDAAPAGVR